MSSGSARLNRRGFLVGATTTAAGASLIACATENGEGQAHGGNPAAQDAPDSPLELQNATVAFDGEHQAGIDTPAQANLNLIGFNFNEDIDKDGLTRLMRTWTETSRRLTQGRTPVGSLEPEMVQAPSNLTITVGFGPRAMELAELPPVEELPAFSRDELEDQWGQTDVMLQICCDDPLTLSHATRNVVRTSPRYVTSAWMQQGFLHAYGSVEKGSTPRNLFGQVDGTVNPRSEEEFNEQVWNDDGSSVMVVRRIKMEMDTWEMLDRKSREDSLGRNLTNGAPLTGENEHDEPDMEALDQYGLPVISPTSHVARSRPAPGHPEQRMLRRPYNYDLAPDADGLSDSGLIFICYMKDPDVQYTPVQQRLDEADQLNEWITHIGSAVYWIPPGTTPDTFWAEEYLT